MKKISIITPCYNEEGNVWAAHDRIAAVMATLPEYEYEHVYIDNKSTDNTRALLKEIAASDPRVKVIFNLRNFGPGPSTAHGFFACTGEAVISLPCDLQDPPEYIPAFIEKWEEGSKVVWGQKAGTSEKGLFRVCRNIYYKVIGAVADDDTYENVTGFGIYDKEVVDRLRDLDDPYPVFRYSILEIGYRPDVIPYVQAGREAGKSSYSFASYLDLAINNVCQTSTAPVRIMTLLGTVLSALAFIAVIVSLILSIIGVAPVSSIVFSALFLVLFLLLFCVGMVGEYITYGLRKIYAHELVYEEKRINF